jgi:hypothetical protein
MAYNTGAVAMRGPFNVHHRQTIRYMLNTYHPIRMDEGSLKNLISRSADSQVSIQVVT